MSRMRSLAGSRVGIIVSVVAVTAVAVVAAVVAGGADEGVSDADVAAITAVIERWEKGTCLVNPPEGVASGGPTEQVATAVNEAYRDAVRSVGTKEFVLSRTGQVDWSALQDKLRNVGYYAVKLEAEVLDVQVVTELSEGGDVVVDATVWHGEVSHPLSADGKSLRTDVTARVDATPTYRYVMRKVGGEWRIVRDEGIVRQSEDDSDEYGPDTPHWVEGS